MADRVGLTLRSMGVVYDDDRLAALHDRQGGEILALPPHEECSLIVGNPGQSRQLNDADAVLVGELARI